MNTISSEIVEKTWQSMNEVSPLEIPKVVKDISKKQPVIMAYLMAAGQETLNEEEREFLVYLGIVIWRIMSQGDTPAPNVDEEMIDKFEERSIQMMEYLDSEPETNFVDTVEKIMENYNQPEILKYVLEALLEEDDEDLTIRDEVKGMMMIFLKVVIDCLDQ